MKIKKGWNEQKRKVRTNRVFTTLNIVLRWVDRAAIIQDYMRLRHPVGRFQGSSLHHLWSCIVLAGWKVEIFVGGLSVSVHGGEVVRNFGPIF